MAEGRVIVVTGPTASGKSALALALAEQLQGKGAGTVINADAMQTYDAFPILTAQPTAPERARVPHALYGVLPLSETLSAARWRTLASAEIERCLSAGRTPILCGGSGLYLRTLMQGIATIPDVAPEIRERASADWQAARSRFLPCAVGRKGSGHRPEAETRRSAASCPRLGSGDRDRPGAQRLAGRHRNGGALALRHDPAGAGSRLVA